MAEAATGQQADNIRYQAMRKHPRLDSNQKVIVNTLRKAGCTVQSLAAIGSGCPDILASRAGVNYVLELKDGSLPPSRRGLTPDEKLWISRWRGQIAVVHTPEEALAAVGLGQLNSLPPLE